MINLRLLKRLLFAIVALSLSTTASFAHDFEVDGIYYKISTDKTVSVTYWGDHYDASSNEYSGKVTIPETVTYSGTIYSVTSIGDDAFALCRELTSVTIGNSVTAIENYAFSGCTGLTSVTIPNSVTSIGDYAFSGCRSLPEVTIPNSVTSIGSRVFGSCNGLISINVDLFNNKYDSRDNSNAIIETETNTLIAGCQNTVIPGSITSIGDYAFWGCSGLTSVTIPNSVTSIGERAFEYCSGLTSVTIPNSVTSIGNSAFNDCSGLTSVTIGNSVTAIENYAFSGCNSLTEVNITDLVAWCNIDFGGNYSNPLICAHHLKLNGSEITDLIIPDGITAIKSYAFYYCYGLTSVTIPNSVTKIGDHAFDECSGLTSVTIGNSVTSIGESAFDDCTGLTSVTFPNSVTSIGNSAFNDCSGLTSVTIGNSVTSIGQYTFFRCSSLTSITIPNSVTKIGDHAFAYCSGLTSISVESGNSNYDSRDNCNAIIETETNTLIAGCQNTVIPGSITSIGDSAFRGCSGLTLITIPNSVTSIGYEAFRGCSGLTEVNILDGTETLSFGSNDFCFNECPLEKLYLGRNLSYNFYSYSPFSYKTTLKELTIGNSVTEIGDYAFYNCSGLTSVTIGNSVTKIEYSAFLDCSSLKSIEIPNSVTSIGNFAFLGCSGLTSVTIPNSVTKIGEGAFEDCTAMTKIYSKAIVPPTCGKNAFYNIDKSNCELYVPQASIADYQAADQWKEFFFIKDIESGIEDVFVEEVAVTVEDGKIVVKNVTGIVTVYNLNGIAVATEIADGNEVRFDNLQPGVYIVVVNNKSVKVVL